MPWTFAHPAAIIPLRRFCPNHFNLAALAIGALTPDFGYYVNLFGLATNAHTVLGSFVVCLPIGLGLLAGFHLVRRPVWHLLPQPHRRLLASLVSKPAPVSPAALVRAVLSILVGAWSHIAWDSFTHRSGWLVKEYPLLQQSVIGLGDNQVPLYHLLQHLSTVIGVVVLVAAYCSWVRRNGSNIFLLLREDQWRYVCLAGLLLVSAAVALPLAASVAQTFDGYLAFRVFVFRSAVYGAALFIPLLILLAVFSYGKHREV